MSHSPSFSRSYKVRFTPLLVMPARKPQTETPNTFRLTAAMLRRIIFRARTLNSNPVEIPRLGKSIATQSISDSMTSGQDPFFPLSIVDLREACPFNENPNSS
jgi:hypothetical protein